MFMCFRYSDFVNFSETASPYKIDKIKKFYKGFRFSHKPESHLFLDVREDGKKQFFPLLIHLILIWFIGRFILVV